MFAGTLIEELICSVERAEIASGQQQAGIANSSGRATAMQCQRDSHCSPNPQCESSGTVCPDCHEPAERLYLCRFCDHQGCSGCMDAHLSEPHWNDSASRREMECGR